MNDESARGEGDGETIPLSREQNAQFDGKTIHFPARDEAKPVPEPETPPSRSPIEENTARPQRSFLSFFDAPRREGEESPNEGEDLFDESDRDEEERPLGDSGTHPGDDAEEPDGEDDGTETLSFDEFVQQEEEQARQEDLDNLIRQNDADTLFSLGEQYEKGISPETEAGETSPDVSISPTSILEAMLFVGNRENKPLDIDKAISLMRNVTREDAMRSIDELNLRYAKTGAPFRVVERGEGFCLELRPEFEPVRERFFGKPRRAQLSQAAIDILALIAYRQPITAAEIAEVRPQAKSILPGLLKRDLIELEKSDQPDAPPVYRTTPRLLKILGIQSISDLPIVDELDYR